MRRRGKTFLSLFLSAVIVTGQPVLAADFSAGEETFISETTEQEGDVSEASAIFEDTVDSDSEMRYEKYEATVSSEILDFGTDWSKRQWLGVGKAGDKKYRHRGLAYQIYLRIE